MNTRTTVMKKLLIIILLFLGFQQFAQSNLTPFSDTYSTTEEEAKMEIANVVNYFYQEIVNRDIDWKIIDCNSDNQGHTASVYSLKGQIRKIEIPYLDAGNNGTREFYYRASGELGLIIDYDYQASQVDIYYHLLGFNKVWNFICVEDISEDTDYLKALSFIDPSVSENEEFVLDFSQDSFSDVKNKFSTQAQEATFDTKQPAFLKGTIDFKYLIIMNLNFKKDHVLTGKYRYQKSKQDILLKGTWTGQRFEFNEYDSTGKNAGRFKGQFVNANTAAGIWTNTQNENSLYFEIKTTASYTFQSKATKQNEIATTRAGIFKTNEAFPDNLPDTFSAETEEKVSFEEGMRFVQHIVHVKKDGKPVLNCIVEENAIWEIEIVDWYRTPDDIGVGSTMVDFGKTYPDYSIWYTYVSDKYVIESKLLGGIQFILDKKDFLGKVDATQDIIDLQLENFKINSKIKSIIIF